jgi:hypothetical protein
MRSLKTALGVGVAAVAAIGFCGLALAHGPQGNSAIHTMTVTLPGGGVEQIQYTGSMPPQITVGDAPAPIFAVMSSFFGPDSTFAQLQRISAAMDRQADQMFREAAALQSGAPQPNLVAISDMPAGSSEYSFVSETKGSNVCSRSMVITSNGSGTAPHVVTHTSGNCSAVAAPGFQVPTQLTPDPYGAPQMQNGPRMIMTKAAPAHSYTAPRPVMAKAQGVHPYAGLVHEASLN